MHAVIATGGKQYRVAQGHILRIERLEVSEGATIEFDRVLMLSDGDQIRIGSPSVDGAKVMATVRSHGRGKKIEIIKFRRRKHHQKRTGHRQNFTEVEITGISAPGIEIAATESAAAPEVTATVADSAAPEVAPERASDEQEPVTPRDAAAPEASAAHAASAEDTAAEPAQDSADGAESTNNDGHDARKNDGT